MTKFLLALFVILAMFSTTESADLLEAFVNTPIFLDAQVESPATNNSARTLPLPKAGDIIEFQIFAPQSANKKSLGYDITFGLAGKNIGDYLQLPTGTTWEGALLSQSQAFHSVTSLLLSQPAYPSSGFWGTVQLQVLSPLSEGDVLIVTKGFVGDVNTDRDALDVSSASIAFTDRVEALGGDIDLDGDVDFVDFLTFAGNFGKKGPIPTLADPILIMRIDTMNIRDTVVIAQSQADLITQPNPFSIPQIFSDVLSIALDANTQNGFHHHNATNGLQVEIVATSAAEGYVGFVLDVSFDPDILEFDKIDLSTGMFSFLNGTDPPSGEAGNLKLFASGFGDVITPEGGRIGILTFKRLKTSPTTISLTNAELRKANGSTTKAMLHNKTIALTTPDLLAVNSHQPSPETLVITIRDTFYITKIDTLTETIRDTITVVRDGFNESPFAFRSTRLGPASIIPDGVVVGLDANPSDGFHDHNVSNGLEIEVYGVSGIQASGFTLNVAFDTSVIGFDEVVGMGGLSAIAGPSVNGKLQMNLTFFGSTVGTNGSIAKLKFKRLNGSDTIVRLMSVQYIVNGNVAGNALLLNESVTLRHVSANDLVSGLSAPPIQGASNAAPTNVNATYNSNATPPNVTLTWTPPASFDSFQIQRATLAAGSSSPSAFTTLALGQSGTSYVDSTVQSGLTYVYRVSTNLSGSISDPSEIAVVPIP